MNSGLLIFTIETLQRFMYYRFDDPHCVASGMNYIFTYFTLFGSSGILGTLHLVPDTVET